MTNLVSTLKLNQTMKYILLFSVLVFLSSCSGKTIEIDNPTDEIIKVTLGDRPTISVPAYGSRKTDISESTIEVLIDDKSAGEIDLSKGSKFLLNPSYSKYYIEENAYGRDNRGLSDRLTKSTVNKNPDDIEMAIFEFDGKPYIGYARVDSNLLIKNIWHYGVKDLLPKQVQTSSGSAIKRKIYREEYFIEHARKLYNQAMNSQ